MVTAVMPIKVIVMFAFLIFGVLKAGTPLAIASMPVSAEQPEANARSKSKMIATCVGLFAKSAIGSGCSDCDGAMMVWPRAKTFTKPEMIITKTEPINRYVGIAKAEPDSRIPRRLMAQIKIKKPAAIATR